MRRERAKHWIIGGVATIVVVVAGASLFVYAGIYNVSALRQHTLPVYETLQFAMERSVAVRSHSKMPDINTIDWQIAGAMSYENHCRRCHGAPGIAPDDFALGMVPAPTAIAELARKRSPQAIYWVVQNGIKMSGMPAWEYRLREEEMWEVVAFVSRIPSMTSDDYANLLAQAESKKSGALPRVTSSPPNNERVLLERGRSALQQYNCVSCHQIPGVTAARNHVGPPLDGITQRSFIAGVLEYSEENLIKWIRFPTEIDPDTTMPNLNVSEVHAREMVAYLKSLDE